jgi:hypothetical protein
MKLTPLSGPALSVWLFLPAQQESAAPTQGLAPQAQSALRPIDPSQPEEGIPDLFTRAFDAERWRARLSESDLEKRERSFDALMQRARLDPLARAFLEELARASESGELAWTARLALRELGRARFPLIGGLADPLGERSQALAHVMNELFARNGLSQVVPPPHSALRASGGRGRSLVIEQGGAGVVMRLTDQIGGEARTRTFSGESLRQVLDQHPELAREFGGLRPSERSWGASLGEIPLLPQGLSLPAFTDRLGVIVRPLDDARAQELALREQGASYGLVVERAYPETYAQLLGVASGDILLELNSVRLRSGDDIERVMRARASGDPLTLIYLDALAQRQVRSWGRGR